MTFDEPVVIERRENGHYRISWHESFSRSPVAIYAAESPTRAGEGKLVHRGDSRSVNIDSLPNSARHYFHLVPESGAGVTYGERVLAVPGGTNLRDFGGYLTRDGRQVHWGKLYRSGQLSIAEERHLAYLANLGIRVNCDFRHARDFIESANTLPEAVERVNYPVDAGSFNTFLENLDKDRLNEASMIEAMCDVNRQLVRDYQTEYRNMFAALLAVEDGGFLLNCTAGKDRTGFGCALILYVLGVSLDTIIYDYLLSLRHFKIDRKQVKSAAFSKKYSAKVLEILKSDVTRPLREVRGEYLLAAFDTMAQLSSSVDQFIEDAYGVGPGERALLRENYTVPL